LEGRKILFILLHEEPWRFSSAIGINHSNAIVRVYHKHGEVIPFGPYPQPSPPTFARPFRLLPRNTLHNLTAWVYVVTDDHSTRIEAGKRIANVPLYHVRVM
jgi:hypothetical protein